MPKKVVYLKWACRLCNQEYDTQELAQQCENKGIAVPRFKKWETALWSNDEVKIVVEVTNYGPDEGFPNPHLLPGYYDINVAYRDFDPCKRKQQTQSPLNRWGTTVCNDSLIKTSIANSSVCPLCSSTNTRVEIERTYNPYCLVPFSFLLDVAISRCNSCGFYFLTDKQSRDIDQIALDVVRKKGWRIASTKKLEREGAFEYS